MTRCLPANPHLTAPHATSELTLGEGSTDRLDRLGCLDYAGFFHGAVSRAVALK